MMNPDGSTSPGQTRARPNLVNNHGDVNHEGDIYLTFHSHVPRP